MTFLDLRVAVSAVVLATSAAGITAVRSARISPVRAADAVAPIPPVTHPSVHRRAATEPRVIRWVAAHNPFHPDRRMGGAFQLPTGETGPLGTAAGATSTNQDVRLLGTVVVGGDGPDFVVCAVDREPALIVRVGAMCGQLRVESVARRTATFIGPAGEQINLELPKVGPQ